MSGGHHSGDNGAPDVHWEKLAVLPASYEADMIRQILESAGIPAAVIGDQTGIFGPGFSGPTPRGVTILVASDALEEARKLVSDQIDAFGGEWS
ncbi:MAG: putative signal transducing protein [Gemmatimonadota bacterium]